MSEENKSPEQETLLGQYFSWLFKGNILFVIAKFVWTGMYVTAFTTFQFIEGGVLVVAGIVVWFIANDWQNWQIEWEEAA